MDRGLYPEHRVYLIGAYAQGIGTYLYETLSRVRMQDFRRKCERITKKQPNRGGVLPPGVPPFFRSHEHKKYCPVAGRRLQLNFFRLRLFICFYTFLHMFMLSLIHI